MSIELREVRNLSRKFLLASHGRLAEGMKDTLEIIIGKQENVTSICAYTNEKNMDIQALVKGEVDKIQNEDELIVLTDIFGGSINNEFMKYIHKDNIHVIAGVNLSLLIEIVTKEAEDAAQIINDSIRNTKEATIYCNELLKSKLLEEEF